MSEPSGGRTRRGALSSYSSSIRSYVCTHIMGVVALCLASDPVNMKFIKIRWRGLIYDSGRQYPSIAAALECCGIDTAIIISSETGASSCAFAFK